ncbi:MAG: PAS domain S-box protein [Rhodocyclales bacterium]|nr:PAS domain S-box protein [Rhodocyclales bacterium]
MHLRIRPVVAVSILAAFAVLGIAISSAVLLWNLRVKDLSHARGETISLSGILAEQTTRIIQNVDLAVQHTQVVLAEQEKAGMPLAGRAVHELLRNRLVDMPQMWSIFVMDDQGKVINTARVFPVTGLVAPDREYFTAHRDDPRLGLFIGAPTHNRINGAWTLYLSRRLDGPNGEFRGVVGVALSIKYFEDFYHSITFDGISPISLYLADGTLVARQPRDEAVQGKRPDELQTLAIPAGSDTHTQQESTEEGDPRIVTYHKVDQFPLLVSVAIDEAEALAVWREKARLIIANAIGIAVIVMLAAWALARELTKEESLSQELWESGQRLEATINSAMDAIVIVDGAQRVVLFNAAAEAMFGCAMAEAIGSPLERFMPERFRAAHRQHVLGFAASETRSRDMAPQMAIVGQRADGREFPIEATISQVQLSGEKLYTAILRDVTERRRAERQLHESNRQLRELSGSLQNVREEERTRISRELHDELGQQLTGLKMDLSWLAKHAHEPKSVDEKIESMKRQVDATIKSVRRISTDLRPTLLDELGLGAAIEWLADDFKRKTGVAVSLDLAAEELARGEALVTSLFRIVQECLTNVARHSGATEVGVSLLQVDAGLELKIVDNGKGMTAAARNGPGGNGLVGIRERALMLGATAMVASWPGEGTEVKVVVPLDGEAVMEQEA